MNRPTRATAKRRATWFREDVVAWLVLFMFGTGVLLAHDYWTTRRVLPSDRHLQRVEDPKIVVLAFDRVVEDPSPNKIASKQLRQHLDRLKSEGFVAVTLDELAAFYRSAQPLPEKSLVLTFDHGYLSSYDAADPILRDLDWPAVLFIMTERQGRRDPFFVYWDRIERMVASGVWEIGSHGHRGHDPIVVDAEGTEGPFFVRPMWLPEVGRSETWEEYEDRVDRDHERAIAILDEHIELDVLAYAPPLRDVAGLTSSPEAHRTLDSIVSSTYALAFVDGRFGINDRRSNPQRLARLRMDPRWSSEELVRRIDYALGGTVPRGGDAGRDETYAWVSGSGQASIVEGDSVVVKGARRADIWRAGSQWVEDWELEADVLTGAGEVWVVQESDTSPSQWRFGGTALRTYLQSRDPGERTEVIAGYPAPISPGEWHHLRLIKRGIGLWVELDGMTVADHPTYLPGRWRGNVGIVHWSDGSARAHLRVRNLRFREIPFRAHVLSSSLATEEIQAAIEEAPTLAALSPQIYRLGPGGLQTSPVDESLLRILSRRFAWEIVPTLSIASGASINDLTVRDLSALSDSLPVSGLRVEWEGFPPESRAELIEGLERRMHELSWKDGRILVAERAGEGET